MNLRRGVLVVCVVASSALVAAGCGGRSKADWAKQVNSLCGTYTTRIDKGMSGPAPGGDRQKQLEQVLPVVDEFVTKVRGEKLPSNKSDSAAASAYVNSLAATGGALHDVATASAAKDNKRALAALGSMLTAGKRSDVAAKKLGLDKCVSAGTGGGGSPPPTGDAGAPTGGGPSSGVSPQGAPGSNNGAGPGAGPTTGAAPTPGTAPTTGATK